MKKRLNQIRYTCSDGVPSRGDGVGDGDCKGVINRGGGGVVGVGHDVVA